ncbi:MAG: N-acetylmuramoyl-L-alanine amidase [Polyangiaceae bacterium]
MGARSFRQRVQRPVLLGLSLGLGAACSKEQTPGQQPSASSAEAAQVQAPPRTRAELVAEADRFAVAGERQDGPGGAKQLDQAARLRRDVWRRWGRRVDALEAMELWRISAEKDWDGACEAAMQLAALDAELIRDPSTGYRGFYAAGLAHQDPECKRAIARAQSLLAAFKPADAALAELQGGGSRAAGGDASSATNAQEVQPEISARASGPVKLGEIESYGSEDAARVVVQVSAPALFKTGFIPGEGSQGPRFFIDVSKATYSGKSSYDVGGIVQRVRLGKQEEGTRVVLDLAQAAHRRVFYLPEPFRLVIDISKHAPRVAQRDVARGPVAVRRVVIDPGHGGSDPGAIGGMGLAEKDVTLDIAHRAAPLIARELGISTLLTRDSDVYVPLAERTARANAFRADLFVSVHCNSSESNTGHGVMTFVLASSNDKLASSIAARENSASIAASTELARVLSGIQSATRLESQHFAGLLQRSALSSIGTKYPGLVDRGVKSAGFYVLAGAEMPAVLFETSFISNPTEEARLDSADYRQKLADAIVNAIRAYRDGV